ncbi:MAG: ABC transporter permease [Blastopirellula sp.]|nr:MAG: ABC transporter permease [Blastopirellula sp.]
MQKITTKENGVSWIQVTPLAIILLGFLIAPLLVILTVSFWEYDIGGMYPAFSHVNYTEILTSHTTINLYLRTFKFTFFVWLITLSIGFSVSYFLSFCVASTTWRIALFLLCTIPFWTSNVIRMIAWIPFLGRNGAINQGLASMGLIDQPLEFLLFSEFAVILTYVHLYTLFMIVPIFNAMSKIDPDVIEAARDAGANGWQIVRHIIVPLTLNGVALGSIFIITLVMGDFFIVRVMSGGLSGSVASAMYNEITGLQYPAAAANAVLLVITVVLLVSVILRFVDVRKVLTE